MTRCLNCHCPPNAHRPRLRELQGSIAAVTALCPVGFATSWEQAREAAKPTPELHVTVKTPEDITPGQAAALEAGVALREVKTREELAEMYPEPGQ